MLRNNYPISKLIGVSLIGLGLMLFFVFLGEFYPMFRENEIILPIEWLLGIGCVFVLAIFTVGIGIFFQKRWARILLIGFLTLVGFIAIVVIIQDIKPGQNYLTPIGLIIFIIAFLGSLMLLLYNKKLDSEFGKVPSKELEDTLDGDFFEK
jgi:hypothetical protein